MWSRGLAAAVLVLGVAAVPGDRVGTVVAGNDAEVRQLLAGVQELNDAVLAQKDKLVAMVGVLGSIADQREAVSAMLGDVNELTAAAARLLSENGPEFGTLLGQLHTITERVGPGEVDLAGRI